MTKDELTPEQIAASVYETQGYLILGSSAERAVGSTIAYPFLYTALQPERMNVALRVIAETDRAEYMAQEERFVEVSGWPSMGQPHYNHYYRCVPQD